jgi:predicted transcriptional regulator
MAKKSLKGHLKTRYVYTTLPEPLVKDFEEFCSACGKSKSFIMRAALINYLKMHNVQVPEEELVVKKKSIGCRVSEALYNALSTFANAVNTKHTLIFREAIENFLKKAKSKQLQLFDRK